MKYVILIHHNKESTDLWNAFSDAERADGYLAYAALNEDLEAAGEMIVSTALADPSTGRRVVVRDGQTIASDGPFAEVKEHLAGFYLIECESIERAIEHAGRIPEANLGMIEVRPTLDLSAFDL